jgi:ParB family chromosome partitioning protein
MTSSPGHIELERSIDSIRIGSRHRADFGDVEELAASIEKHGLLQPITVTPDGVLVCGARRLAALRQLGVRKLNVWVRSGISDRLTQLLAEQDDNALHKPLSPTESAALYREVKVLLAEDARRRQQASRFGSIQEKASSDGAATVASPEALGGGNAREQAALLVSGRRSYTTLERIGELQRIAADKGVDEDLRNQAAVELGLIDDGGSVASAHRRINTQLAVSELEKLAGRATEPRGPESARGSTVGLRAAEHTKTAAELEIEGLARQALARVKTATKAVSGQSGGADSRSSNGPMPVRSFVYLWTDLQEWWLRYDATEISARLTSSQWAQFEATLAGTLDFAEQVRARRANPSVEHEQLSSGVPVK